MAGFKLKVTPEMESLTQVCVENSKMDPSLYGKYDVKRGLRDVNGKGVLAGLTQISSIYSTDVVDGKTVPCEGRLYYRGYDIHELTQGFLREQRFGFEEVTYLLLFGKLPNEKELAECPTSVSESYQCFSDAVGLQLSGIQSLYQRKKSVYP